MGQVDKPSKEDHDKELDAFNEEVEKIKAERQAIQDKIDAEMDRGKGSETGQIREQVAALRTKKGMLIEEKKKLRNKLDQTKDATDKLVKDRKDTRSNVRFSKVEEVDAEISKLQRRQETTSMSLTEEKKLIQEINSLQSSKKLLADLKNKEGEFDDIKEQRKSISAQLTAKDKEIDAVSKEMDDLQAKHKEMSERETDKRDATKALLNERDELRKKMSAVLKEKDACRAAFREKSDAWFNYQRALRAQKKMQYEEEKKKRDEERQAWMAAKEAEEAKKIPYEEEQALCEYLADYLERTYLFDGKTAAENEAEQAKNVVEVKDDPFAGMKPINKKDEDAEYFGKGKGKKKRVRNTKKEGKEGPFRLNVDTFEQFGLIGLTPPTSLDLVAKSVKDLRERKEWYSKQPRGSVPTAIEIRKASERAVQKLRSNGDAAAAATAAAPVKKDGFALSTDDFVPLSANAAPASNNSSSWGKNADEGAAETAEAAAGTSIAADGDGNEDAES